MIQTIEIFLAAHTPRRTLTDADFLFHLDTADRPVVRIDSPGGSNGIVFHNARYTPPPADLSSTDSSEDPGARAGAFQAAINRSFLDLSNWLDRHPATLFDNFRATGLKLTLFIDTWIDQDQIDIEIPPRLLLLLGARGISLYIISND